MKRIRVAVAWASPAGQDVVDVELADGATLADAVAAAGGLARAGIAVREAGYAIFGQVAQPSTPLADADRVEITRPLCADPKAIRRTRAKAQAASVPARRTRREPGA